MIQKIQNLLQKLILNGILKAKVNNNNRIDSGLLKEGNNFVESLEVI